jgi:hypothetical protein
MTVRFDLGRRVVPALPTPISLRLQMLDIPISPDGSGKVGEDKAVPCWPPPGALERRFEVEISINIVVPSFGLSSE